MLSMYDSEQYLFEALKAGASGYVLLSEPVTIGRLAGLALVVGGVVVMALAS
jgi:multidrug transporter EmrE-like cation transporter